MAALPALRTRRGLARTGHDRAVIREVELQKMLSTPICDLNLEPTGVLSECIEQLHEELRARGITFFPEFYLGDDDFWTSDRAISVNIPWYLANGVLWRLVNDHLFRYTRAEVLMYLRHETGHALNYAYELWRRRDWTATFGDFRRPYRNVYNPNPWSRDYVRYLHRTGMYHYAQKHPDEDFAETFAVWLDPSSRWRRRYRDWQVAQAKLEYVDRLIEVEGCVPRHARPTRGGASASPTPTSRRRSPNTSRSPTSSTPTWPNTARTCWTSSPSDRPPRATACAATPSRRPVSSSSTSGCSSIGWAAGSTPPTGG